MAHLARNPSVHGQSDRYLNVHRGSNHGSNGGSWFTAMVQASRLSMARRLSDENVHGLEIADQFGITRQHVGRIVSQQQHQSLSPDVPLHGSVVGAVLAKFERYGLDPDEDVEAATVLALAEKLDAVRGASSAQSAIAAPGLARALDEAMVRLLAFVGGEGGAPRVGPITGRPALVLLTAVGHPEPHTASIDELDAVELLRIKRQRRLAGLSVPESLLAAIRVAFGKEDA